jgi:glycosyltransferase involved in cell wall biosynthesis
MIEALACGTPVIAWRRGSVPEVLADGVTGYIVESVSEAVDAVGRLDQLNRCDCRRAFEECFTDEHMTRDYLRVYERLAKSADPGFDSPL